MYDEQLNVLIVDNSNCRQIIIGMNLEFLGCIYEYAKSELDALGKPGVRGRA